MKENFDMYRAESLFLKERGCSFLLRSVLSDVLTAIIGLGRYLTHSMSVAITLADKIFG